MYLLALCKIINSILLLFYLYTASVEVTALRSSPSRPINNVSFDIAMNQAANHYKRIKRRNFVFGYGSLICPDSRAETNPNLADKEGLPVLIQDVERVWSARTKSGYTAMGVHFKKDAECTGVLIEVSDAELDDLDRREAAYNRLPIHLDNIDQVPFLGEEEYYDDDHPVFEAKEDDNDRDSDDHKVKVWIYMQKDPIPADPSHPIAQSYVDIIVRGCLTYGEEFARSFIETTEGWHGHEEHEENEHWVDDREDPLYVRADPEFSKENGELVDQLLEDHEPKAYENRIDYDAENHLEAIQEALDNDLAHPRAVERIEKKVGELNDDSDSEPPKQEGATEKEAKD